jgi:hypothetical protein
MPARGIFFAAAQGVTGGISVGVFLYLAGKYGLVNAKVPVVDGNSVRQLQQLEIGTGVAFYAIYVWGVVDALLNYKPTVQIQGDTLPPSLFPPEKTPGPPANKKTSSLKRLHLAPMVTPDSVGIGLTWEND